MMAKPGERTAQTQKKYKHAHGEAANGVANKFLAKRRGQMVSISDINGTSLVGKLVAFDMYAIEMLVKGMPMLVYKGPGLKIAGAEPGHEL